MKHLISTLFIIILISFITGFYFKSQIDDLQGDRIIGISVLATVFILFPLFIYHRSKGKKMSDYMFTKENIEKMNEHRSKKPDNQ